MGIEEFASSVRCKIVIERPPSATFWLCHIEGIAGVDEALGFTSYFGTGNTPEEAIAGYLVFLRGCKRIAIRAEGRVNYYRARQMDVPADLSRN